MSTRRRGRQLQVTPAIVQKMRGLTDEINSGNSTRVDPVDPIAWVMAECRVSMATINRWRRGYTSSGDDATGATLELLEEFAAALDGLCEVCARASIKAITELVTGEKCQEHKDHFAAAKWLAGKTFPDRWDDKVHSQVSVTVDQAPATDDVCDVPQGVWDEMTNEEYAQHEAINQQIEALQAEAVALLKGIGSRLD